jgi:hypothetical protein
MLEGEIAGVPGSILHFYAVATYVLQHPDSMNCRREALAGLRTTLADSLDGRANLEEIRRRARSGAKALGRVTRRADDDPVSWPRGAWPVTIADVCTTDSFGECDTYDALAERLRVWARSVRDTLDAEIP